LHGTCITPERQTRMVSNPLPHPFTILPPRPFLSLTFRPSLQLPSLDSLLGNHASACDPSVPNTARAPVHSGRKNAPDHVSFGPSTAVQPGLPVTASPVTSLAQRPRQSCDWPTLPCASTQADWRPGYHEPLGTQATGSGPRLSLPSRPAPSKTVTPDARTT
jgi:hypothetical protein